MHYEPIKTDAYNIYEAAFRKQNNRAIVNATQRRARQNKITQKLS